jgi:hypothetical protein
VRSGREAITRSLLNNVVEDYCRRLVYTWLPKVRRCNGPFDMMSLAIRHRWLAVVSNIALVWGTLVNRPLGDTVPLQERQGTADSVRDSHIWAGK